MAQQALDRLEAVLTGTLFRVLYPVRPLQQLSAFAYGPLKTTIRQPGYVERVGVRWVLVHRPGMARLPTCFHSGPTAQLAADEGVHLSRSLAGEKTREPRRRASMSASPPCVMTACHAPSAPFGYLGRAARDVSVSRARQLIVGCGSCIPVAGACTSADCRGVCAS
jgi:hypothetical protein